MKRGFTLIEILLALALFAIGFAMMMMLPASAVVMENRYETVVEAEIASTNVLSVVSTRKAFWPVYEPVYMAKTIEGGYVASMGSAALRKDLYWQKSGNVVDANGNAIGFSIQGGKLKPTICMTTPIPCNYAGPKPGTLIPNAGNFTAWAGVGGQPDQILDMETYMTQDYNQAGWNPAVSAYANPSNDNLGSYATSCAALLDTLDTNRSGRQALAIHGGEDPLLSGSGNGKWYDGYPAFCAAKNGATSRSYWQCDYGDCTDFARGRIHAAHNRLLPDAVFPLDIRSYPSAIPLAQRRQYVSLCYTDNNLGGPTQRNWSLYAVAHGKSDPADAWPESGTQQNAGLSSATAPSPLTSGYLGARMRANPLGLHDKAASAAQLTDVAQNCQMMDSTAPDGNPLFNHGYPYAYAHDTRATARSLNQGSVTALSGSAFESQHYPPLMRLPAIIYDWNASQIQVAYPREYLPLNIGGAMQSDRRLKVGDHLIAEQQGIILSVKSILPETRPQYAVADQAYYQIVEVYPPLSESMLGGPATNDPAVGNQNAGGNAYPYWRLQHIFVAPAPAGQTASTWNDVHVLPGESFMSANLNQ